MNEKKREQTMFIKKGDYVKVVNQSFSTLGRVGQIVDIDEEGYFIVLFGEPICGDMIYRGSFLEEDLQEITK